jgi:hypothetical protein
VSNDSNVEKEEEVTEKITPPPARKATPVRAEFEPAAPTAEKSAGPAARQALTNLATNAVTDAVISGSHHPLVERFGESVGLALGVIVTEALSLSKEWNAPLTDANGQPLQHVDGADRIGDHPLRKRHEEVVGPLVEKYVAKLSPGIVHDLLEGFAKGATAGPGTSYRLEAAVSDALRDK